MTLKRKRYFCYVFLSNDNLLICKNSHEKGKNKNDPMRFVKKTSVTTDGEIAEKQVYALDEEQIKKEELYDGFYAVITNLEGDISEIIKINKQHWEIEENFRIMISLLRQP